MLSGEPAILTWWLCFTSHTLMQTSSWCLTGRHTWKSGGLPAHQSPLVPPTPAQSQDNQTSPSTEEEERLWAVRPDPRLLALVLGITSVMGAEDLRDRDGENAGHCLALLSHLRRQEAGGFQHMNRQVSSRTCCPRPKTWSTGRSGSSAAPR